MIEQLQLDGLFEPKAVPSRLAEFLEILRARPRWFSSAELKVMGWTDRELRTIAEEDTFSDIFSYPGSPGYKAFEHVTEEEFQRCQALRNQGRKMIRRFIRYWNRRHKGRRA